MFLIVNQCHKQTFNSPRECLCDIHNMCKYIWEWTHAGVCVFHLRVMCIFVQDSVIFCHDMSWCKLVHLSKRGLYRYSTNIDTSSGCLGTHTCRYFAYRQMCSWLFQYMVRVWLENNNKTSTNVASVDEVYLLFVNNCCNINC